MTATSKWLKAAQKASKKGHRAEGGFLTLTRRIPDGDITDELVLAIVRRLGVLANEKVAIYERGDRDNIRRFDEFSAKRTKWENSIWFVEREAQMLTWMLERVAPRFAQRLV